MGASKRSDANAAPKEEDPLSSAPSPPPSNVSIKAEASPEESWLHLDCLRVRMEMLPGGLVIERDTNITRLQTLMAQMQQGEVEPSELVSMSQAYAKHAEILAEVVSLTEIVEGVEMAYWQWCSDAAAAPLDAFAKQQVNDWLMPEGEKQAVLDQMRQVGARRCPGPSISTEGTVTNANGCCGKYLQYGLYKANVRRCPACIKESKRLTAVSATQKVRQSLLAGMLPRSQLHGSRRKGVLVSDDSPSLIPVESRDLAFAVYAGSPNTYYHAHVLASDLEFAKANGTAVSVHWADGDRRHRSVPVDQVIMMDHPWACDVQNASAAIWNAETQRLVPSPQ